MNRLLNRVLRLLPLLSIALVIGPATNLACSCVHSLTVSDSCSDSRGGDAVFIGKVVRDSGRGWGSGRGHMIVENVLQGLPENAREVEVDSSSRTSCYFRLEKDQRYVIYGESDSKNPRLIHTGVCSGSFMVRGHELLVQALLAQKGREPSRIVGVVRERTTLYGSTEQIGKSIKIVAEREGERLEALSLPDGQFEFRNVAPGAWRLRPETTGVIHDSDNDRPPNEVRVPIQGCAVSSLSVRRDGHIRGVVRDSAGTPVRGVPVEVFSLDIDGKDFDSKPFAEAMTGEDGAYDIGGLPPQQYIVGINGKKYSDELSYAPHYFGETSERQKASRISLKEIELLDHIDLVLPPSRLPASLVLKVEFEDGRPARTTGYPRNSRSQGLEPRNTTRASISDLRGVQRAYVSNFYDPSDGTFRLPLWQGETYKIKVSWSESRILDSSPEKFRWTTSDWEAEAGPLLLDQPETEVRLVLRLKKATTFR